MPKDLEKIRAKYARRRIAQLKNRIAEMQAKPVQTPFAIQTVRQAKIDLERWQKRIGGK